MVRCCGLLVLSFCLGCTTPPKQDQQIDSLKGVQVVNLEYYGESVGYLVDFTNEMLRERRAKAQFKIVASVKARSQILAKTVPVMDSAKPAFVTLDVFLQQLCDEGDLVYSLKRNSINLKHVTE